MEVIGLLFSCLMLGAVLYQLVSGRLLDRNWMAYTTLEERPKLYWLTLAIETAGALTMAYFIIHDFLATKH